MTPDEMRAKLLDNVKALADASKAAGDSDEATKAAKKKEEDEKSARSKEALEKAQGLSEKCMKAASALRDHVTASANDDAFSEGHKGAVNKAHKAVKAAHEALGGEADENDEAGEKAVTADALKAVMADAIKAATAPLEAQIKALEAKGLGPRGAGPGGVAVATAAKGAGAQSGGGAIGEPAMKAISDMTPAEKQAEMLRRIERGKIYAMPARDFAGTGNEVLKALAGLAQDAESQQSSGAV